MDLTSGFPYNIKPDCESRLETSIYESLIRNSCNDIENISLASTGTATAIFYKPINLFNQDQLVAQVEIINTDAK